MHAGYMCNEYSQPYYQGPLPKPRRPSPSIDQTFRVTFRLYPRYNRGVPHTPDLLWSFVGSQNFMRLSIKESRTRGPVQSGVQEIRGISLVFREMWDTAGLPLKLVADPTTPQGCPMFAPALPGFPATQY